MHGMYSCCNSCDGLCMMLSVSFWNFYQQNSCVTFPSVWGHVWINQIWCAARCNNCVHCQRWADLIYWNSSPDSRFQIHNLLSIISKYQSMLCNDWKYHWKVACKQYIVENFKLQFSKNCKSVTDSYRSEIVKSIFDKSKSTLIFGNCACIGHTLFALDTLLAREGVVKRRAMLTFCWIRIDEQNAPMLLSSESYLSLLTGYLR